MDVVITRCAGLDVHQATVVAIKREAGRSLPFMQHVRPTRCRLRPCRSMKVSSSDSTERRSFGTFMRPSLATNLAAQRARDTSARPDWTRMAASSSSNNPTVRGRP